jgi:HAE1 family hydrophobic/amphiphilic exporter-1
MFGSFSSLTQPMEIPYYTSGIQVSQPLFTFGKIGTAIKVANEFDSSIQCSNARNFQQLQLLALDAFYQAVLSDMVLAVSQRSLSRKKELSEFLSRNFSLGSGNKAYLLASQADLNSQYSDMISARQNARSSKLRLCAVMGRELADSLDLDTVLAMPALLSSPVPAQAEAVKTALDGREDLRAMDFMAQANRGGAKIFNAMYLPSIGLSASLGTGGSEAKDLVDWEKRNWTVGVGMQWNLFDGFSNSSKAQQFLSDARKLEIAHKAVRNLVEIEIRSAISECAAADSNQAASRDMLAAAREGYDLTSENFKQGSGQFSDLQLAEERLQQAELGRTSAQYRWIRSRAALRVAMGLDIIKVEAKK